MAEATSEELTEGQLREMLKQAQSQLAQMGKQLQVEQARQQQDASATPRIKRPGMAPPTYQTPKRQKMSFPTPFRLGKPKATPRALKLKTKLKMGT